MAVCSVVLEHGWHVGGLRACGPECLCMQGFRVEFSQVGFRRGCKVSVTVCVGKKQVSVSAVSSPR